MIKSYLCRVSQKHTNAVCKKPFDLYSFISCVSFDCCLTMGLFFTDTLKYID